MSPASAAVAPQTLPLSPVPHASRRPVAQRSPGAASPRAAASAPPAAWIVAASSSIGFKLRGEIRFPPASPPVKIELQLFVSPNREGKVVQGTVRFLDDPTFSGTIRVQGVWNKREIMLGEILTLPRNAYYQPVSHSFVLDLPASDESGEVTGIWNYGVRSGKLVLTTVPPL